MKIRIYLSAVLDSGVRQNAKRGNKNLGVLGVLMVKNRMGCRSRSRSFAMTEEDKFVFIRVHSWFLLNRNERNARDIFYFIVINFGRYAKRG